MIVFSASTTPRSPASKSVLERLEPPLFFADRARIFEDQIREGPVAALALPGATPLQGGIPIVVDGKVIGAIGATVTRHKKMKTLRRLVPQPRQLYPTSPACDRIAPIPSGVR